MWKESSFLHQNAVRRRSQALKSRQVHFKTATISASRLPGHRWSCRYAPACWKSSAKSRRRQPGKNPDRARRQVRSSRRFVISQHQFPANKPPYLSASPLCRANCGNAERLGCFRQGRFLHVSLGVGGAGCFHDAVAGIRIVSQRFKSAVPATKLGRSRSSQGLHLCC